MKNILEPLAVMPGVRTAALVTPDGVPMCVHGARAANGEQRDEGRPEDLHALAGLATGWMGEISRAVAPLSWDAPRRLVLRAARGTLVIVQAPGALLIVVFEGGMQPEELRLPMDVAVQRMQRHLRSLEKKSPTPSAPAGAATSEADKPHGIFPRRTSSRPGATSPDPETTTVRATGNGGPEVPHVIGD